MFYLSFLIRDGKCALNVDDGEPVICMYHTVLFVLCFRALTLVMLIVLCEQPSAEDYGEGLNKQQMVMELDMATWEVRHIHIALQSLSVTFADARIQRAIEVFDIKQPIIPQRPKVLTRIGDKWYG